MPTFAYQARDKTGQPVSGTREASDRQSALEALRGLELFVTNLSQVKKSHASTLNTTHNAPEPVLPAPVPQEVSTLPAISTASAATPATSEPVAAPASVVERKPPASVPAAPASSVQPWMRASAKDSAVFFRQMYSMLNAGINLAFALQTMGSNAPSIALRSACQSMSRDIAGGKTWSESMSNYPTLFPELAVGMINAGERGGFLDRVCLRLAEYGERDYEIQQMVKRETWYPKLLIFASILIPSVVPLVLASLGVVKENPFLAWLRSAGPQLLIVGAAWGVWKWAHFMSPVVARAGTLRWAIDSLKLRLPIAGKTARALAAAKFCRVMGASYAAGIGTVQTLNLAANACGNAAMAEGARRVIARVEAGDGLTDSLASTGYFPTVALHMMRTGESSGNLDQQLDKVADFLESDAETTIKQSITVLGQAVFLLIALKIGIQVISFYGGYLSGLMQEAGQ